MNLSVISTLRHRVIPASMSMKCHQWDHNFTSGTTTLPIRQLVHPVAEHEMPPFDQQWIRLWFGKDNREDSHAGTSTKPSGYNGPSTQRPSCLARKRVVISFLLCKTARLGVNLEGAPFWQPQPLLQYTQLHGCRLRCIPRGNLLEKGSFWVTNNGSTF